MHKNVRKVTSAALALTMSFSMAVPSFAALTGNLIPNQGGSRSGSRSSSSSSRNTSSSSSSNSNRQVATAQPAQTISSSSSVTANAEDPAVTVMISGMYDNYSRSDVLNRVNAIRKEAADEGIVDSYVPMTWSGEMEAIARQRAAEAIMSASHTRPNNTPWYDVSCNDKTANGESLSWGKTAMQAVEAWYAEKANYTATGSFSNAGDYYNLINPKNTALGFSSFSVGEGTIRRCVAAEVGRGAQTNSTTGAFGTASVNVRVLRENVTIRLNGTSNLAAGKNYRFEVVGYYADNSGTDENGMDPYNGTFTVSLSEKPTWTSNNPSVATVNENGTVTGVSSGSAAIIAEVYGTKIGKNVKVS